MANTKLHEQLEQLQHTLSTHPELDAETLTLLQKISTDLKQMGIDAEPEMSELVQEQAIKFEQEYPTLAEILRRIVDTLGNMGV